MPTLDETFEEESFSTRILAIGASGSGKTGSLAALANAGYQLKIADFDNSARAVLSAKNRKGEWLVHPSARKLIDIRVYADKLVSRQGNLLCDGTPQAFHTFFNDLDKWDGGLDSWPSGTIFVLDTLTMLGDAKMRNVLFLNGKDGQGAFSLEFWGIGQNQLIRLFEHWKVLQPKATIICFTHFTFTDEETEGGKKTRTVIPTSIGNKLGLKLPSYFPVVLGYTAVGETRKIHTVEVEGITCKMPGQIPPSLPQETGLVTILKSLGIEPAKAE